MKNKRDRSAARGGVRVEHLGAVALLTLDRPGDANALTADLVSELASNLKALDRSESVRVMVLAGSGASFATSPAARHCLEALRGRAALVERQAPTIMEMWASRRLDDLADIGRLAKPLIAAVGGDAVGEGLELALSCDLLVVARDARLSLPAISMGVIPSGGGTQRLTRSLGKAAALELILTGADFSGAEAFRRGLANRAVARGLVLEESLRLAQKIASRAPAAVRAAKEAVQYAAAPDLESGLRRERVLFSMLFGTDDVKEAMRALMARRRPAFKGR